MDRTLVLDDFADKLGDRFVIAAGDDGATAVTATLAEAQALPARGLATMTRPPFSLVFVSDHPVMLRQQIYRMEHAMLGAMAIFLVPIGRDSRGFSYQATFN
jgi:hypothetical protein